MNFWDTSALIPLFAREETSERMSALQRGFASEDPTIWILTPVEFSCALFRMDRQKRISPDDLKGALSGFEEFIRLCQIVKDIDGVKLRAIRVARYHPLTSADALQLAAALAACGDNPPAHSFVSLDRNLAEAASKEGFKIPL